MIKFIFFLLLTILIYNMFNKYSKYIEFKEKFNTKINKNISNINKNNNISSFNINQQCNNKNFKKYLGWKCFIEKFKNIKNLDLNENWGTTPFYNYLKKTHLTYDGI